MIGLIKRVIIHGIGNKTFSEGVKISKSEVLLSEKAKAIFASFLDDCKMSDATYHFFHESNDLSLNPLFVYANRVFNGIDFNEISSCIAKQLYESSDHPRIHSGELIIVLFDNCKYDGERCSALGVFKSESKDNYLDVTYAGESYSFVEGEGINVNSLEKGAIIYNTKCDFGYCVRILMRSNKQVDAKYWMNDFLHVRQSNDSFYRTQQVISLTNGFIREVLEEDDSVTKIECAKIRTRASEYLYSNALFDSSSFCEEVFIDKQQASSFVQYKDELYGEECNLLTPFEIDTQLLKKQSKKFRKVIRLDDNFHLYVHGSKGLIKRGYDEITGMKYYQLFFTKEE